jgi:hypothetical protein
MICDVCGRQRSGVPLANQSFRDAVFSKGFDPFSLGLVSPQTQSQWSDSTRWGSPDPFANWKKNLVAINEADWFICSKCRKRLLPYFERTARSTSTQSVLEEDWHGEQSAIILGIFLCFPLGLYFLWRTRTFSRRAKIIILAVYASIMAIAGYLQYALRDIK